jgi:hypothetical protein
MLNGVVRTSLLVVCRCCARALNPRLLSSLNSMENVKLGRFIDKVKTTPDAWWMRRRFNMDEIFLEWRVFSLLINR